MNLGRNLERLVGIIPDHEEEKGHFHLDVGLTIHKVGKGNEGERWLLLGMLVESFKAPSVIERRLYRIFTDKDDLGSIKLGEKRSKSDRSGVRDYIMLLIHCSPLRSSQYLRRETSRKE